MADERHCRQRDPGGRLRMTANRPLSPSSQRRLPLRCRRDLEVNEQQFQGRRYWVLKDPLTLKYFRFEEEEYQLLQMFDGVATPTVIKQTFDARFSPQKITLPELFQFSGMLHRSGLLISDNPGQGPELLRRGLETRWKERRQSLTNLLSIRYRGFDPDSLLTWLDRWLGWCFRPEVAAFWLVLGLSAIALIVAQADVFAARLPSFENFFSSDNWLWLALVLGCTKVIHELAHGLACKRFGGQCHEMGLMLLVFTPCLYVNVSDSWLLPNKWHRALIAAAGMLSEWILASVAVFVWWFSTPGLVNQLALNVIFVCSVSTLLFNGNPLLRYDGYYILSDLLEIPNLRSKATAVWQRTAGRWLLGIEPPPDPFLPTRNRVGFGLYAVAAALYRWLITFVIFWFVYRILEPYGLQIIGQLLALSALFGLVGAPLLRLRKYFSIPGRWSLVKPIHAVVSMAVMLALLGALLGWPLPHYVYCDFHVQAADTANVYVDVPGSLAEIYVRPNQQVRPGQPLVRLHSQALRVQLASLATEVETAAVRLSNLQRASATDESVSDGILAAEVAQQASLANYHKRQRDEERLIIRAPIGGRLLAAPRLPTPKPDADLLPTWHGDPLEPRNLGAHLPESTLVGKIIPDPHCLEAVLAVDQSDIEFVQIEEQVDLLVDQLPAQRLRSHVALVTPTEMKQVPKPLSQRHGGPMLTETDRAGNEVPISTKFLVKVPLEDTEQLLLPGSTGRARILTGTQTVGQRIWRLAQQTFQFEL